MAMTINTSYPDNCFSYYNTYCGNVSTLKAKKKFLFCGINEETRVFFSSTSLIWRTSNPKEFAFKVMTDATRVIHKPQNVIIFQTNGNIKHLVRQDNSWVEIDPSGPLDISQRENSINFYYSEDKGNGTRTYTGRGKFLFTSVQESTGSCCSKAVTDIWSAETKNEFAKKVVVKGSNSGGMYLVLFLVNGKYLVYFKTGTSSSWTDDTKCTTISTLISMGIIDEQEANAIIQKTSAKTKKRAQPKPAPRQPKPVTQPEQVVMAHTKVVPSITKRQKTVPGPHPPTKSKKPDSEMKQTEGEKLKAVLLDITYTEDNEFYKVSFDGTRVTFDAIKPYLFKQVKRDGEVLWEAKNYRFPNKIIVTVLENDRLRIEYSVPQHIDEMVRHLNQPKPQPKAKESQPKSTHTHHEPPTQARPRKKETADRPTKPSQSANRSQPKDLSQPTNLSQQTNLSEHGTTRPKRRRRH